MKSPMESNVLLVDRTALFAVFGEKYWNDHEDIVCVPTERITQDEAYKMLSYKKELNGWQKAQYLISEGNQE
jgi:hypothetical protein